MHAADHINHKDEFVFLEALEPDRITFQYLDPVHNFLLTMSFAEERGRARITWRQRLESTAHGNQLTPLVMRAKGQMVNRASCEITPGL
jgi:hypothetical protein